jgi:hypothetical protein
MGFYIHDVLDVDNVVYTGEDYLVTELNFNVVATLGKFVKLTYNLATCNVLVEPNTLGTTKTIRCFVFFTVQVKDSMFNIEVWHTSKSIQLC